MEDEGLADGAPAHRWWTQVQNNDQHKANDDGDGRIERAHHKHHCATANQAEQGGVPREVLEGRPANGARQSETDKSRGRATNKQNQ